MSVWLQTNEPGKPLSEVEMAEAFQCYLESGKNQDGLLSFARIYREANCRQGRPDFIGLKATMNTVNSYSRPLSMTECQVVAFLKRNSPRTYGFLKEKINIDSSRLRRTLSTLCASEIIREISVSAFVLGSAASAFDAELWSFELKLSNAKRAVFQAQQSRAYASKALIIVPPGRESSYFKYEAAIRRWSIGLAVFDATSFCLRWVIKGIASSALSRPHLVYTMSRLREA